jgi:phosphatidylserine/phosphatidylglycerophosphate/cardiolipin synthase-like enzyme
MIIENMGILNLFSPEDSSYSGKDSYRYVERVLKSEKNLMIVSPYIDDYYAGYLVKHSRGKRIRILSSSMQPGASRRLRKGRNLVPAVRFSLLAAAFNVAFFLLGIQFLAFLIVTSAIAVLFLALSLRRNRNISVRVPKGFVHAKMYVGDSVAVEGSANLTYAGMHNNVEHIDVIHDRKRIGDLKRQFAAMWDSA